MSSLLAAVPDRAGAQDDDEFSSWRMLHDPARAQRIVVLMQNDYAHYAAVAGSIAIQLSSVGHEVALLPLAWTSSGLNSHVRSSFGRQFGSFPTPDRRVGAIVRGLGSVSVDDLSTIKVDSASLHIPLPRSAELSLSQLLEIQMDNLPVGSAVRDEVIRRGRGSHPEVRVKTGLARALAANYLSVYHRLRDYLNTARPDLVIVFNGRFVPESAAVVAADSLGIPVAYYEAGGQLRDYDLYMHPTHDIAALSLRCAYLPAQGCSPELLETLADAWYRPRTELAHPEISRLGVRLLNGDSRTSNFDVLYFSSSSDELEFNVATGVEAMQREGLRTLHNACQTLGLSLTVRTHPNMRSKSQREQSDWESFLADFPSIRVISQRENDDPYSLAGRARAVVTFASTIGIECMRMGIPTVVTGPAVYSLIPGVATATTLDELVHFLGEMPQPSLEAARDYGAFQMVRGLSDAGLRFGERDQAELMGRQVSRRRSATDVISRVEWRVRDWRIQHLRIR